MNRKRIKELYAILNSTNKELEDIRKNCPHKKWRTGNYMWAPGHINNGAICNLCDTYLGEARNFNEWLFKLNDGYDQYNLALTGKINKHEKITCETFLNKEKLFIKKEFLKELETKKLFVPKELETYNINWRKKIE